MKLFGRSQGNLVVVDATVTDAAAPPQSLITPHYGDWVWVVADLGSGPVNIRSVVPLPKDRWLLPGMRVSITVQADHLEKVSPFEIDFDKVPTIRELVASNDRVVADPRAARASAVALRHGAATPVGAPTALWSKLMSQAWIGDNFAESYCPRPGLDTDSWSVQFDQEVAAATTKTTEPGRVRGVAILTAIRMDMRSISHNLDGTPELDRENPGPQRALRGVNAVLTVSIPGRAPYAAFVEHFKPPRSKPADLDPTLYPWLPVQVSLTDQNDLNVAWDEVQDRMEQLGELFQSKVDERIEQVEQIQREAGVTNVELPTDVPPAQLAAQQLSDLTASASLPPEVAEMMRKAGGNLTGVNKHMPAQFQGAIDDAMRMAAQQMANAQQMMTSPAASPADAPAMSSDQQHQSAVHAAEQLAPRLAALPAGMRGAQVGAVRSAMEAMSPETRDACLEVYRKAGLDI